MTENVISHNYSTDHRAVKYVLGGKSGVRDIITYNMFMGRSVGELSSIL